MYCFQYPLFFLKNSDFLRIFDLCNLFPVYFFSYFHVKLRNKLSDAEVLLSRLNQIDANMQTTLADVGEEMIIKSTSTEKYEQHCSYLKSLAQVNSHSLR